MIHPFTSYRIPGLFRVLTLPLLLLVVTSFGDAQADAKSIGNISEAGFALQGYDPVSYFPEGGGVPREGEEGITHVDYRRRTERPNL